MGQNPFVSFCEEAVPRLEEYRGKNVNKYYREKESPDAEYTKCERYKNRVRFVDCFLPAMKAVLKGAGVLLAADEPDEREIP
jgi:hypothetical protein